jgi:hypothetical protein
MKDLREMSARELDELFREATIAAARHALGRGVSVMGLDMHGELVTVAPETNFAPDEDKSEDL